MCTAFTPPPITLLRASAKTAPATVPGDDTGTAPGPPGTAPESGRLMTCVPFDPAANASRLRPRKKKSPSTPNVRAALSHTPPVRRNPSRKSLLTRRPPKRTSVIGLPSVPALAGAVPTGDAVTSGGSGWPDAAQYSHSKLTHARPGP